MARSLNSPRSLLIGPFSLNSPPPRTLHPLCLLPPLLRSSHHLRSLPARICLFNIIISGYNISSKRQALLYVCVFSPLHPCLGEWRHVVERLYDFVE